MSWLYSPLLPGAAQQEADAGGAEDAAGFAAGAGASAASGAAIASAAFSINAASLAAAVADDDGPAEPAGDASIAQASQGGGAYIHPDLLIPRKKKRKPRVIDKVASHDAESDFRTLWEAVKIHNDPRRLNAAMRKRAAILADLEKSTLIRNK